MRPSLCTFTGVEIFPLTPRVGDIRITDIAHALGNACRFSGHTRDFYSVAQHSVVVADLCVELGAPELEAVALLHDATEAYLVDVPSPIKQSMHEYKAAEARLLGVIFEAFGLDPQLAGELPTVVKAADRRALEIEQVNLMPRVDWWKMPEVGGRKLEALSPRPARALFLRRYAKLLDRGALRPLPSVQHPIPSAA